LHRRTNGNSSPEPSNVTEFFDVTPAKANQTSWDLQDNSVKALTTVDRDLQPRVDTNACTKDFLKIEEADSMREFQQLRDATFLNTGSINSAFDSDIFWLEKEFVDDPLCHTATFVNGEYPTQVGAIGNLTCGIYDITRHDRHLGVRLTRRGKCIPRELNNLRVW